MRIIDQHRFESVINGSELPLAYEQGPVDEVRPGLAGVVPKDLATTPLGLNLFHGHQYSGLACGRLREAQTG